MAVMSRYARPRRPFFAWHVKNCCGYRARLDGSRWITAPSLIDYTGWSCFAGDFTICLADRFALDLLLGDPPNCPHIVVGGRGEDDLVDGTRPAQDLSPQTARGGSCAAVRSWPSCCPLFWCGLTGGLYYSAVIWWFILWRGWCWKVFLLAMSCPAFLRRRA